MRKNHLREAQIIAQAGKKKRGHHCNEYGRGTDIILGGNADFARNEMRATGMEDEMIENAVSHAATDDPNYCRA